MRTIKFRAWNKQDKTMNDVSYLSFLQGGIKADGAGYYLGNGWATCNERFNHDCDVKLMQFTGLVDKNGEEIYEGDVVITNQPTYDDEPTKNIITFSRGAFIIQDCGVNEKLDIPLYEYGSEYIEIIGNIYENPELLLGTHDE